MSEGMNRSPDIISIEPRQSFLNGWIELFQNRELLYFFVWRDLIVRYKQTAIGMLWLALRPAMFTAILYFVFSSVDRFRGHSDAPYYLVILCGIVPWFYFSSLVSEASNVLVSESSLISKVYFPRIMLPLVSVLTNLVDLTLLVIFVAVIAFLSGVGPSWRLLAIVPLLLACAAAGAGLGMALSILTARYRDFRFLTAFILQAGLFLSPVIYTTQGMIPEKAQLIYFMNPMAGIIEGLRWALLDLPVPGTMIAVSMMMAILMLVAGILLFKALERDIADIV